MSLIRPRHNEHDAQVTSVNKHIKTLANKEVCAFINHEVSFRLIEDTVDQAAFLIKCIYTEKELVCSFTSYNVQCLN